MRKPTMWFLNRSDTNRTLQPKKMARSLKKLFSEFMILGRGTRKPTFCNCENKSADQLRSNRKVDQRLCFCYTDSTIPLLKSQISCFCDCTGWFASVLLGNPNCWFSHATAHIISTCTIFSKESNSIANFCYILSLVTSLIHIGYF